MRTKSNKEQLFVYLSIIIKMHYIIFALHTHTKKKIQSFDNKAKHLNTILRHII